MTNYFIGDYIRGCIITRMHLVCIYIEGQSYFIYFIQCYFNEIPYNGNVCNIENNTNQYHDKWGRD